jgi:hypothetical protein
LHQKAGHMSVPFRASSTKKEDKSVNKSDKNNEEDENKKEKDFYYQV